MDAKSIESCTELHQAAGWLQDLEGCADTLIGDEQQQIKGISGGQKRRVRGRTLRASVAFSRLFSPSGPLHLGLCWCVSSVQGGGIRQLSHSFYSVAHLHFTFATQAWLQYVWHAGERGDGAGERPTGKGCPMRPA